MRRLPIGGLIAVITLVLAFGPVALSPEPIMVAEADAGSNWNASYYNNTSLSGDPVLTRVDDKINFDWGTGSPDGSVSADNFSARWKQTFNFPTTGNWTFRIGADDGVRLWIDVTPIVDEWHGNAEGYRVYEVAVDYLTAGDHELTIEYYEATGNAKVTFEWWNASETTSSTGDSTIYGPASWSANYFNNTDLSGSAVLSRTDGDVSFNWADGSPGAGVNADNFSARWTTTVNFSKPGHWRFKVGADDGVRMWIDVTQIVDEWHGSDSGFSNYEVDVYSLTAGNHELKVEYYEATGNAGVQVRWWYMGASADGSTGEHAVPEQAKLATVYAGVTAENVNVRSGPGRGNPAITQIFYPDNYLVVGGVGDLSWLLIDLGNGTQGWVSNEWVYLFALEDEKNKDTTGGGQPDFVDDIPRIDIAVAPPAAVPQESLVILTGKSTDTLNLRDGASLYAADIIGAIPQGAIFQVEAHNGNGAWYLINYQGVRGWVSAEYVSLLDGYVSDLVVSTEAVPAPPLGSVVVPQTDQGTNVTVRGTLISGLFVRDAASNQGSVIGEIPNGTTLVIEGRNTNGAWYLVSYEGVQGWIFSPYVTLIEGQVTDLPLR